MKARTTDVLFLSTYPPRECGIATFTQDLVKECRRGGLVNPRVMAVSDRETKYGKDVYSSFDQSSRFAHLAAAQAVNRSGADVVMVEHEYGIFGGADGEYLMDLLTRLELPYLLTCHTVLPRPSDGQHRVLSDACRYSAGVVVMSELSRETLAEVYGVDPGKIYHVHHGTPVIKVKSRDALKNQHGLKGRSVVSTFGLLSPGKGLEHAIESIALVAKKHPDVFYLVLGQTHPTVKRESGEDYRERLEALVERLGIKENVRFVNKYLGKKEIVQYLKLSDIYLTPYLNRNQAVSGTLAYAVGCGRVVVSTPYLYAQEMLAEGRGLLARFGSAQSLADCVSAVLECPEMKARMEKNTAKLGRQITWPSVTREYETLFSSFSQQTVQGVVS